MKPTRRKRLFVEQLEHRECPIASISLAGDTLFVRGPVIPDDSANNGLQITLLGNDYIQVQDGTHFLGRYRADNVDLLLSSHTNSPIKIDLDGYELGGNLLVSLGAGDTTYNPTASNGVMIFSSVAAAGSIGGNVTVLGGSGSESILPGTENFTTGGAPIASTGPVTIGGDMTVIAKATNSTINGQTFDTGATYAPAGSPSVTIGGNLTVVGNIMGTGVNTTVGGNVTLTEVPPASVPLIVSLDGTFGGNVTVTGSQNPSPPTSLSNPSDYVAIGENSGTAATAIGGNLAVSLGYNVNNEVLVGPAAAIAGNVNLSAQAAADLDLSANVNGNATLIGGSGNVAFEFDEGSGTTQPTVNGNLTIIGGNGAETQFAPFAGVVNGNLDILLGNGLNNGTWQIGTGTAGQGTVGGKLTWNSGNGPNELNIAAPGSYDVDAVFGNNNDTFAFGGAATATYLSGSANGGGRVVGTAGNDFIQNANGVLSPYFMLSNFP